MRSLFAVLLLGAVASAQHAPGADLKAQVAMLEAAQREAQSYCSDVDARTSKTPAIIFVADGVSWHRLRSGQQLPQDPSVSVARVWIRQGRVLRADLSRPESRDRFAPASYCFRPDGSLARVTVVPKSSLQPAPRLVQEIATPASWYFSAGGRLISEERTEVMPPFRAEVTRYVEPRVHFFKQARELPFYALVEAESSLRTIADQR